jgi:hypothetical protein
LLAFAALEGGADAGDGIVVVGCTVVVDVGFVVDGDVEAVFVTAAGDGGVTGFGVEVVGGEDVRAVAGEALGFVDGHGVAVVDVTGFEVRGWDQAGLVFGVEVDGEPVGLSAGDRAALAVDEPMVVVVVEGDDPVTDRVGPAVEMDRPVTHDTLCDEDGSGGVVEGSDITSVEGEHDRVVTLADRRPPIRDYLLERGLAVWGFREG